MNFVLSAVGCITPECMLSTLLERHVPLHSNKVSLNWHVTMNIPSRPIWSASDVRNAQSCHWCNRNAMVSDFTETCLSISIIHVHQSKPYSVTNSYNRIRHHNPNSSILSDVMIYNHSLTQKRPQLLYKDLKWEILPSFTCPDSLTFVTGTPSKLFFACSWQLLIA